MTTPDVIEITPIQDKAQDVDIEDSDLEVDSDDPDLDYEDEEYDVEEYEDEESFATYVSGRITDSTVFKLSKSSATNLTKAAKWSLNMAGKCAWYGATTFVIVLVPAFLSAANEQMLMEMQAMMEQQQPNPNPMGSLQPAAGGAEAGAAAQSGIPLA